MGLRTKRISRDPPRIHARIFLQSGACGLQTPEGPSAPIRVAPEQLQSLLSLSTTSFSRFLPRKISGERALRQRIAELDRAVLRNVSNLDSAMRQNIEEAFRRFEVSLRHELALAVSATSAAMRIALDRHRDHEEAVSRSIKEMTDSVARLDLVLQGLATATAVPSSRSGA